MEARLPAEREAGLLRAFRQGDRRAFDTLYRRYGDRVFRFGLRLCGHEEDARDVLQDTFLNVFRYLPSFRGEASLQAWIFRIASSACLKRRRRGKYLSKDHVSLSEAGAERQSPPEPASPAPGPLTEAMRAELARRVDESVERLPRPERAVLVLRDLEGLSADETARALGLSVPAVKSRLHRARRKLRRALEDFAREA
jgi:RNA polymerase sigma-70 factor (ECF subfamily)